MSNSEKSRSVAFGFPGQGAHEPDKMKRLLAEHPTALELALEAEEVLDRPVLPLLLQEIKPNSTSRENQTRLYIGSSALWMAASKEGIINKIAPDGARRVFFGASAGEYAALMADDAYSFADGLQLIDTRGEEMHKASIIMPGTMFVAIGLPFKEGEKIAREFPGAWAKNDNPGIQTVFTGRTDALQSIVDYLKTTKEGEVRIHWADIAEAAHSIHMEPAIDGLKRALKDVRIKPPSHDFIGNQARRLSSPKAVREHLWRQLTRGVRLTASANVLYDDYDVRTFVDVGPGKVLQGQMKRHFRRAPEPVELISIVDELLPDKD